MTLGQVVVSIIEGLDSNSPAADILPLFGLIGVKLREDIPLLSRNDISKCVQQLGARCFDKITQFVAATTTNCPLPLPTEGDFADYLHFRFQLMESYQLAHTIDSLQATILQQYLNLRSILNDFSSLSLPMRISTDLDTFSEVLDHSFGKLRSQFYQLKLITKLVVAYGGADLEVVQIPKSISKDFTFSRSAALEITAEKLDVDKVTFSSAIAVMSHVKPSSIRQGITSLHESCLSLETYITFLRDELHSKITSPRNSTIPTPKSALSLSTSAEQSLSLSELSIHTPLTRVPPSPNLPNQVTALHRSFRIPSSINASSQLPHHHDYQKATTDPTTSHSGSTTRLPNTPSIRTTLYDSHTGKSHSFVQPETNDPFIHRTHDTGPDEINLSSIGSSAVQQKVRSSALNYEQKVQRDSRKHLGSYSVWEEIWTDANSSNKPLEGQKDPLIVQGGEPRKKGLDTTKCTVPYHHNESIPCAYETTITTLHPLPSLTPLSKRDSDPSFPSKDQNLVIRDAHILSPIVNGHQAYLIHSSRINQTGESVDGEHNEYEEKYDTAEKSIRRNLWDQVWSDPVGTNQELFADDLSIKYPLANEDEALAEYDIDSALDFADWFLRKIGHPVGKANQVVAQLHQSMQRQMSSPKKLTSAGDGQLKGNHCSANVLNHNHGPPSSDSNLIADVLTSSDDRIAPDPLLDSDPSDNISPISVHTEDASSTVDALPTKLNEQLLRIYSMDAILVPSVQSAPSPTFDDKPTQNNTNRCNSGCTRAQQSSAKLNFASSNVVSYLMKHFLPNLNAPSPASSHNAVNHSQTSVHLTRHELQSPNSAPPLVIDPSTSTTSQSQIAKLNTSTGILALELLASLPLGSCN